jgi:ABC-2 type transport system ATP-binding protein
MLMAGLYGMATGKARKRTDWLLEKMGLFPRRNEAVKTYSKGMRQRLILAMALVSDPEILFLDEPTAGLDVQSARLIRELLQDLNSAKKTIFLTTHDMDEANQLCERVAIINQGKVVAIDAPEKLRMAVSKMRSVEVSFDSDVSPELLASLDGVEVVKKSGDKYRLYTAKPGEVVVSLVNHICPRGARIVSLNIIGPSLEDAFVALTETKAR